MPTDFHRGSPKNLEALQADDFISFRRLVVEAAYDLGADGVAPRAKRPDAERKPHPRLDVNADLKLVKPPTPQRNPTYEEIRDKAYQLWVRSGRPIGMDEHFWHQADEILGVRNSRTTSEPYFWTSHSSAFA